MSFAGRLASLDEEWDATQAHAGSGPVPPGDYQARVEKVLLEVNERSKHVDLKTVLEVSHGDYEGRTVICWHDLEDPERFPYAKAHIAHLGIDAAPLSTLEERLPQALDGIVEIAIRESKKLDTKGRPFRNVYVNRLVTPSPAGDVVAARAAMSGASDHNDDDSIPF